MGIHDRHRFVFGDGRGHPDTVLLAEYADNVLPLADRRDLQYHLADCEACRDALSDAMLFSATDVAPALPVHRMGRRRWIAVVVTGLTAAAAIFTAVRAGSSWWGRRSDQIALAQLIAAVTKEPTRPFDGRLSQGFPYAPAPVLDRGERARHLSPDVRIAAATIEKLVHDQETPGRLAVSGVASAVLGDFDRSVSALERATQLEPDNARYLSDLSAIYLARANLGQSADDYMKALASAARARSIDSTLSAGCFNWALALERLSRSDEARRAWEGCLSADSGSAWSTDIRAHIARLPVR